MPYNKAVKNETSTATTSKPKEKTMKASKEPWSDALRRLNACGEAVEWSRSYPDISAAWQACERGDWMLWLIGRADCGKPFSWLIGRADCGKPFSEKRKPLVRCACACARIVSSSDCWKEDSIQARQAKEVARVNALNLKVGDVVLLRFGEWGSTPATVADPECLANGILVRKVWKDPPRWTGPVRVHATGVLANLGRHPLSSQRTDGSFDWERLEAHPAKAKKLMSAAKAWYLRGAAQKPSKESAIPAERLKMDPAEKEAIERRLFGINRGA